MRQVPPRAWLAAALSAALVAGCRHPDAPGDGSMPGQTPASYRLREAADASHFTPLPPPPPFERGDGSAAPSRKIVPVRHTAPPAETPTAAVVSAVRFDAEPRPEVPARLDVPHLTPRRLPPTSDNVVIFAHAPDHRWLMGVLVHEPRLQRWSIRYANPGEPDVYGGLLELIDTGTMAGFCSGQLVRVEGDLIDPQPHQIKPSFRVRTLQSAGR